jgi:HD-GYP domain-containing protein (c-di-GMP phosphodiesterase class II)
VKLVPFSAQHLRLHEALPFGLRDAAGNLLLACGQRIDVAEQLERLAAQPLFADDAESADWRRRLAHAVDHALRQDAPLKEIAAVLPGERVPVRVAAAESSLPEQWEDLTAALDAALRDARADGDWLDRVAAVRAQAAALAARRLDASLYCLTYRAGHSTERYCAHHSLLAMVICGQAAERLGWTGTRAGALELAALTMNVAMVRLQDLLAQSSSKPTPAVQAEIDAHPARGAALLRACGVEDPLWIDTVRRHHEAGDAGRALAELGEAMQLARLLRRVDIFTAKLSQRRGRGPMSPVQAAKEACLGGDGRPDELGAALLKAVGLYPPGSFVELASGETGIVVSRGERANLPLVATLVTPAGTPVGEPALRDTGEARYAVRQAVRAATVRVTPAHGKVLALL